MLIMAVNIPLLPLAPILIEQYGRQKLFLLVTFLSILELGFLSVAELFLDFNGGIAAGWGLPAFLAVIGCILGHASIMLGLLSMAPILIGEICPYAARPKIAKVRFIIGQFKQTIH